MAVGNRAVGSGLYFSFMGTVCDDGRNFQVSPTVDTVDKTAGTETSKSFIATLKDQTATLTYAYSHSVASGGTTGTFYNSSFKVKNSGYLEWGPQGSVAGFPKGGGTAIVTAHSAEVPYDGLITRTVNFQFSGVLDFDPEEDQFGQ